MSDEGCVVKDVVRRSMTLLAALAVTAPGSAGAQSVTDLQRQIDELRAEVRQLTQALAAAGRAPAPQKTVERPAALPTAATVDGPAASESGSVQPVTATVGAAGEKSWYKRLRLRGYTQLRYNAILDGSGAARDGISRLRSVHDSSINDDGGFLLRRARLVLQGDVTDRISLYLQHDFGAAVNNQSTTERRENFGQLRDAYVDVALDKEQTLKLRFGQSKVPFGWENLQSSSNRLALDRSDGINSGVPGERDLGVGAWFTPRRVQAIWDRLEAHGQKLFGNYGAFGVALYNGQGTNRTERNAGLMKVAIATWPFELEGLGDMFAGQVLEVGGSAYLNAFRPELRSGGVAERNFSDRRIGVHAILYPQPIGVQAEWNWGRGPEYDIERGDLTEKTLNGGYVQLMYDAGDVAGGSLIPYGRWQRYRGGWKANVNAPRLETDEWEIGVEWQAMDALELTLAFANMSRREADERRLGRADGNLIRTQIQWNY